MQFVVPSDQQGSNRSRGGQERTHRASNPFDDPPNSIPLPILHEAGASTSDSDHLSTRSVNPPAYTEYPGPVSVMSPASRARTRVARTKTGLAGRSILADSTRRRYSTTTVSGASSIPELDDLVEQLRLGRPETMSETGGTLATGMSAQLPRSCLVVENPDSIDHGQVHDDDYDPYANLTV